MIRREDESKHRRKETGSSRGGDSRQVIIYDCNNVCDEDWEEHNHKENKESDLRDSNGHCLFGGGVCVCLSACQGGLWHLISDQKSAHFGGR